MAQTIIIKNGTGSSAPATLEQGELAINVSSGSLWYGSGSGANNATHSSFTFGEITASAVLDSNGAYVGTGTISSSGLIYGASGVSIPQNQTFQMGAAGLSFNGGDILIGSGQGAVLEGRLHVGGHISASHVNALGSISSSADISASGDLTANNITGVTSIESTLYTIDGQNAIDYATNTHLFGSTSKATKLRSTVGVEMTSNVTVSGEISSSDAIYGTNFLADTSLQIAGKRIAYVEPNLRIPDTGLEIHGGGHITASGNISASGDIHCADLYLDDVVALTRAGGILMYGNNVEQPAIDARHDGLWINGSISTVTNITASGDISASEGATITATTMVADRFYGNGSNLTGVTGEWDGSHTGNTTIVGNISSSGNITNLGTIDSDGAINVETGGQGYKLGGVKVLWVNGSTDQVGRYSTSTTITGSVINLGATDTVHVTASGHVSASGNLEALSVNAATSVSASSYVGTKHLLYSGTIYINANTFGQNKLYFGNNYGNQDSNWNDPTILEEALEDVTAIEIAEDDAKWGMMLPFDVSSVEVMVSVRPGGTGCTGDNYYTGMYTSPRPNNSGDSNMELTRRAFAATTFNQGKYTSNDFTYTGNLDKGTLIFIGIGSNEDTEAKSAPTMLNVIITQR
jgi:hypothetical protein